MALLYDVFIVIGQLTGDFFLIFFYVDCTADCFIGKDYFDKVMGFHKEAYKKLAKLL